MPTAMASGKDCRVWASVSQQELLGRKGLPQKEQLSSSFRSGGEPCWGLPMDVESQVPALSPFSSSSSTLASGRLTPRKGTLRFLWNLESRS